MDQFTQMLKHRLRKWSSLRNISIHPRAKVSTFHASSLHQPYSVSPAFVFDPAGVGLTGYGGPFASTLSISASYP